MKESLCILWCVMGVWLQIFLLWWRPLGATAAGDSLSSPTGVWVSAHAWAPHHRKYIYPCTNFLNPNKLFQHCQEGHVKGLPSSVAIDQNGCTSFFRTVLPKCRPRRPCPVGLVQCTTWTGYNSAQYSKAVGN